MLGRFFIPTTHRRHAPVRRNATMTDQPRNAGIAEGSATEGGDILGPGTGGSPTAAGTREETDRTERADALRDPAVARLVDDLRRDERVLDDDIAAAAEQAGTGTDR
jgi:hypothetical protein